MIDVEKVVKVYNNTVKSSEAIKKMWGSANSYRAANKYATMLGEKMTTALITNSDFSVADPDADGAALVRAMSVVHSDVMRYAGRVQQNLNTKAGLGLKPVTPSFETTEAEYVRNLAEHFSGADFSNSYLKDEIINQCRHYVDNTIKANMEAQEDLGLKTHIVRTYDDIGLHGGKDVCEWCLEREGEWDNYQEAYDAGVFERHPGCGCVIEYHVGKTHTRQDGSLRWEDI